jgi:hypothetical protein
MLSRQLLASLKEMAMDVDLAINVAGRKHRDLEQGHVCGLERALS